MSAPTRTLIAPNDTLAVLIAVREMLTPESWTTEYLALLPDGTPTVPENPGACEFCLLGAILRVTGRTFVPDNVELALIEAMLPGEEGLLSDFNDDRGLDAVHRLLDRAIATERERRAS